MNLDERAVNVFTDGSSLPSPRRGGIGIGIFTVDDAGHEVIDLTARSSLRPPRGGHGRAY